jgi:hypothetical protein
VLALIRERQGEVDVDGEELSDLLAYIRERLTRLRYDLDRDRVQIPAEVAREWFRDLTGDRQINTVHCSRRLQQAIRSGELPGLTVLRTTDCRGYLWSTRDSGGEARRDIERRIEIARQTEQRADRLTEGVERYHDRRDLSHQPRNTSTPRGTAAGT